MGKRKKREEKLAFEGIKIEDLNKAEDEIKNMKESIKLLKQVKKNRKKLSSLKDEKDEILKKILKKYK